MDHNDREDIDRGKWRKYNPYAPDVDDEEEKTPAKIEQLDDLFSDDEPKSKTDDNNELTSINNMSPKLPLGEDKPTSEPIQNSQKSNIDLQKELEAKFDELFGSLNDTD